MKRSAGCPLSHYLPLLTTSLTGKIRRWHKGCRLFRLTIRHSVADPDWSLEAKNDPQERKNEELSCFKDLSGGLEASGALTRETRKGWPLLTVETDANGNSRSTNERGPSLVGPLGFSCRYKSFLFCHSYSTRPSTTFSFPYLTLFISFVPIARQAVVPGHLSLTVIS